jgi:hypothetical protein
MMAIKSGKRVSPDGQTVWDIATGRVLKANGRWLNAAQPRSPAVSGTKQGLRITVPRTNSRAKASVASGPVQVDAAALYRSGTEAASAYDYPRGPGVAYPSNLFPEVERSTG